MLRRQRLPTPQPMPLGHETSTSLSYAFCRPISRATLLLTVSINPARSVRCRQAFFVLVVKPNSVAVIFISAPIARPRSVVLALTFTTSRATGVTQTQSPSCCSLALGELSARGLPKPPPATANSLRPGSRAANLLRPILNLPTPAPSTANPVRLILNLAQLAPGTITSRRGEPNPTALPQCESSVTTLAQHSLSPTTL